LSNENENETEIGTGEKCYIYLVGRYFKVHKAKEDKKNSKNLYAAENSTLRPTQAGGCTEKKLSNFAFVLNLSIYFTVSRYMPVE
jgi:hypothetical protein